MKKWPDKLKLLTVLSTTPILLDRSEYEGWGLEEPTKYRGVIDQILDFLFFKGKNGLPEHWDLLYGPTGSLQEISIANGWSEIFSGWLGLSGTEYGLRTKGDEQ
jgi:hypothetical protein